MTNFPVTDRQLARARDHSHIRILEEVAVRGTCVGRLQERQESYALSRLRKEELAISLYECSALSCPTNISARSSP